MPQLPVHRCLSANSVHEQLLGFIKDLHISVNICTLLRAASRAGYVVCADARCYLQKCPYASTSPAKRDHATFTRWMRSYFWPVASLILSPRLATPSLMLSPASSTAFDSSTSCALVVFSSGLLLCGSPQYSAFCASR